VIPSLLSNAYLIHYRTAQKATDLKTSQLSSSQRASMFYNRLISCGEHGTRT